MHQVERGTWEAARGAPMLSGAPELKASSGSSRPSSPGAMVERSRSDDTRMSACTPPRQEARGGAELARRTQPTARSSALPWRWRRRQPCVLGRETSQLLLAVAPPPRRVRAEAPPGSPAAAPQSRGAPHVRVATKVLDHVAQYLQRGHRQQAAHPLLGPGGVSDACVRSLARRGRPPMQRGGAPAPHATEWRQDRRAADWLRGVAPREAHQAHPADGCMAWRHVERTRASASTSSRSTSCLRKVCAKEILSRPCET